MSDHPWSLSNQIMRMRDRNRDHNLSSSHHIVFSCEKTIWCDDERMLACQHAVSHVWECSTGSYLRCMAIVCCCRSCNGAPGVLPLLLRTSTNIPNGENPANGGDGPIHLRIGTTIPFARLSPIAFAEFCSQMEAQRPIWEPRDGSRCSC